MVDRRKWEEVLKKILAFSCLLAGVSPAAAEVTLTVNSWAAPNYILSIAAVDLCDDIASVTEGRVKCNILPKAVASPTQTFDAVVDGIVDIGYTVHGYNAGRFPLTEVVEFPLFGDTSEAMSVAYQRIFERMLAQADEHKGVMVLAVHNHGPGQIFTTRKKVEKLADLNGLKMRIGGGVLTQISEQIGVVPLLRPAPEAYEMLSTGVADGVFFAKDGIVPYNLPDVIGHATFVPGGMYNLSFGWFINPDKWNSIPEADRNLIQPLFGEAFAHRIGKIFDTVDKDNVKALDAANIPYTTAGPEFVAELDAKIAGLKQAWIEKAKAKGIDGAAVLEALETELETVRKELGQ